MTEGFSDPVVGGLGTLIRQYIQSQNYVPGSTGWRISQNGDAEFNNAIFRGVLEAGSISAGSISSSSIGASHIVGSTIDTTDIVVDNAGGTILVYALSGQTITTINATGAGTFSVPAGVTELKVECYGAGGGGQGGAGVGTFGGLGGAGGEYAAENHYVVTPLANLSYVNGTGGTGGVAPGGQGATGTNTSFDGTVIAHGGSGTFGSFQVQGGHGSTNSIHFNGGSNSNGGGGQQSGSGGGGSAGSNHNGNAGGVAVGPTTPGAGGFAGGGGAGGGGNGGINTANGAAGGAPGGAGGGGGGSTGGHAGGAGANGRIRITYGGTRTLIGSIAGIAGTDIYGNAYPAGIRTAYKPATGGTSGGYFEEFDLPATVIAAATTTVLVYSTNIATYSDYGSAYNTSTGLWTCPADGVYEFGFEVGFGGVGATRAFLMAFKNGAEFVRFETDASATGAVGIPMCFKTTLVAGDTMQAKVQHTVGATTSTGFSHRAWFERKG